MASNRKIERLGISGDIIEKLHQLEIFNAKDLLELSPFLLKYHLDITLNEAKKILQISSEKLFPKSKTALELYHERSKLAPFQSTGCTKLNQFLHGGFQFGNITELVGLPGVGKSQICMSCCAAMLIQDHYHRLMNPDHHQSTIVYYDTELKFDSNRMITMIKYQYNDAFHHEINNEILEVFLNQIQVLIMIVDHMK
jgi:RAD51-like protein 1